MAQGHKHCGQGQKDSGQGHEDLWQGHKDLQSSPHGPARSPSGPAEVGARMCPRWAKLAASCAQNVLNMSNLEPKMGNLARFWEHLGDFFGILEAILSKPAKTRKTTRVEHF